MTWATMGKAGQAPWGCGPGAPFIVEAEHKALPSWTESWRPCTLTVRRRKASLWAHVTGVQQHFLGQGAGGRG